MKHLASSIPDDPANYVREVTARYIGPRRKSVIIANANIAADFMRKILKDYAREHFVALYLGGSHRLVSYSVVSIGSATGTQAHPREVLQPAVLVGACAIIIGHNHPSGDLNESDADIAITKVIKQAADILGIRLLDHVIFSHDKFLSLVEAGRISV